MTSYHWINFDRRIIGDCSYAVCIGTLQERRSTSGIFAGKYGLITLRDLFRWAERYEKSSVEEKFHDWDQQLAEDGNWHFFQS